MLRKVGHCVLFCFQETGPGGMKSRQLAQLHPPGRRENPFPAMEVSLWHSRLQRTPADPIRKPWRWRWLLCTPLALPREQKNSLPAFPTRGSSWCQGLRWCRLGTLRSPAAVPGHTRREVLELAPILLLWCNFGEMGSQCPLGCHSNALRWALPLPVPGQGRALLLCQQRCCHCLFPATVTLPTSELLVQPVPPATGASDALVMPTAAWYWEFQGVL